MNLVADEGVDRAVLLTADKDFGELVFRQSLVHSGVVLLRLAGLANATKAERLSVRYVGTVRRN